MKVLQIVIWDLVKRPIKTSLIVLMLTMATVSLIATSAISQAAFQLLQSYLKVLSPNVVIVAGPVLPVSPSFVASLPGVKSVYPLVLSDGYLRCNSTFRYVMLVGYSNLTALTQSTEVKLIEGKFGVDVSRGLSDLYGKRCELVTSFFGSYNLTIEGVIEMRGLEEVLQRTNVVIVPMRLLEGALPNALIIIAKSPRYVSSIQRAIENATAGQAFIFSQESFKRLGEAVTNVSTVTSLFLGFLSLSIASVAIVVISLIDVKDRKWEIGLLKALGFESRDLALVYALESLTYSCVAIIAGSAISYLLMSLAKSSFAELLGGLLSRELIAKSLSLSTSQIVNALVIVIGVNLLGSLVPALISYKMDPVQALRQVE